MRHLYLILFITIISSCASEKKKAINSYIANMHLTDTTFIIKEKLSNEITVHTLKALNLIDSLKYSVKDIEELERLDLRDKSKKYWAAKDFDKKDFIVKYSKDLWTRENDLMYFKDNYHDVLLISDPIFYKDKKHLIFTIHISMFPIRAMKENYTIVMKKEKGKWIIVEKLTDYTVMY